MRNLSKLSVSALLCAVSVSCSIKEPRAECPCLLAIELSDCLRYPGKVRMDAWTAASAVVSEELSRDLCDSLYEIGVPRGNLVYSVSVASGSFIRDGHELYIPDGAECGVLFAHTAALSTDCESVTDTVMLHKQFSRVSVRLTGFPEECDDVSIVVSAQWNGLSLNTLTPLAGALNLNPERRDDGSWDFYLLRQGSGDVSMDIYAGGELLRCVEVGKYLEEIGFDWMSEDLDDIRIGVDHADASVVIEIDKWIPGNVYDVEQ